MRLLRRLLLLLLAVRYRLTAIGPVGLLWSWRLVLLLLLLHADPLSHLPQLRVGIQIIPSHAHDPAFSFTSLHPFGPYDGDVHVASPLPLIAPAFRADEVRGVYAYGLCNLGTDAIDGPSQTLPERWGKHPRRDRNPAQIRHLVRLHRQFLATIHSRTCSQDQVKDIFGIDRQPGYLCRLDAFVLRNHPGFGPIAVQAQTSVVCSGKLYLVPFEYDGGLSGIPAADYRWGGGSKAVGGKDGRLERGEGFLGDRFGVGIARDCDVYYGAGGYGRREKDGGKFDLGVSLSVFGCSFGGIG